MVSSGNPFHYIHLDGSHHQGDAFTIVLVPFKDTLQQRAKCSSQGASRCSRRRFLFLSPPFSHKRYFSTIANRNPPMKCSIYVLGEDISHTELGNTKITLFSNVHAYHTIWTMEITSKLVWLWLVHLVPRLVRKLRFTRVILTRHPKGGACVTPPPRYPGKGESLV